MYYEDYEYDYPQEDMKTEFHIALDDLIDAEVEKRLEERVEDIGHLRERQKQYDEKISEANNKAREAENKRHEAEIARMRAERERDNTIEQCKQSISDVTQQKLDEMFGGWLKERYAYYLETKDYWEYCPYCSSGQVNITLPNGDKAVTKCKVCGGNGYREYKGYTDSSIETNYPTFVKDNNGNITPYFLQHRWNTGMTRVALSNVMTYAEAKKKAEILTEENKQKALQCLKDIKERLDKENHS